jgi:hypothetical protein
MLDKKTTGILLIAHGHPYYSRLAYNLLASIRYHDKDIPVAIAVAGEGFNMMEDWTKIAFTDVIQINVGSDPYRIKLELDRITPFDRTLYLDVDTLFSPNRTVKQLLDQLAGNEFQCIVRGRINGQSDNKSEWMDMAEIESAYGFNEVYDLSSEVIYFEGKPKVFETARKIYDNPKVKVKEFGGGLPDEAFFTLALEMDNVKLPLMPFEPTYWQPRYFTQLHSRQHIQDNYFLLSVGGANYLQRIKEIYDSLCDMYFYQTQLPGVPFPLQPKSRILTQRRLI